MKALRQRTLTDNQQDSDSDTTPSLRTTLRRRTWTDNQQDNNSDTTPLLLTAKNNLTTE